MTASNANIVLSSVTAGCTNDKVVFRVDSGATNGDSGGAEIADATALDGWFTFVVTVDITGAP